MPTATHTSEPTATPTPYTDAGAHADHQSYADTCYRPILPLQPRRTQSDTSLDLADVVEQARAGVVRIEGTTGSGSGFVVDPDGYILTNEHVINGQSRLTVVFDNGTRLAARVIVSDASRDIALLKVTATSTLTVLQFATSVREGEEVIALGYPLGGDLRGSMTITKGIVSAFPQHPRRRSHPD